MATDPTSDKVQIVLSGPWKYGKAALEACRANDWTSFVKLTAPAGSLFQTFARNKCLRIASHRLSEPEDKDFAIAPVWVCDAEEEPSSEWVAGHLVSIGGRPYEVIESGPRSDDAEPRLDTYVTGRLRQWTGGRVVLSRNYALSVPLVARHGAFGVLSTDIYEVTSCSAHPGEPLPRPTSQVPIFASWLAPRSTGLPDDVLRAIQELSIVYDEEGAPGP